MVPIFPSHQSRPTIHAMVSKPSAPSARYFSNFPSEPQRPRQSWKTTA